jgi:hypothetical protein
VYIFSRTTESGPRNLFDSLQNYESRHNAQYRTNLSSLSSLGKGKGIAMPHLVISAVLSSRGLSVGGADHGTSPEHSPNGSSVKF